MTIPVHEELTLEQRRQRASEHLAHFFATIPAAIRERVQSLPRRIAQMNARLPVKLQEVLHTADLIFGHAGQYAACARGCDHCCHVHVPITDFEAQPIICSRARCARWWPTYAISSLMEHSPSRYARHPEQDTRYQAG